ncbi:MAG: glycosyltransferase [Thermoanaerobaculia bacterium]
MTILAALLVFAWIWALSRTLLNLALIPRLRPQTLAREPFVSIVIPARNEERAIGRTVRALLAQTYRNLEIIVVDDQSADGTPRIVAEIAGDRVTLVRGEAPPPGWLGKPWALHQGSLRAKGELLFFVDADVFYSPEALGAAVARIEESGAALLTIFPNFEMEGFWENVGIPQLALGAFMLIPSWLSNRTTRPSLGIGGGTGNLVRREAYAEADGHVTLHQAIVDDVALARLIRTAGGRTELVRAEDLVSIRMYHGARSIIDGFTKNFYIALGARLWIVPLMIAFTVIVNLVPYAFGVSAIVHAIRGVPVTPAEWLGCAAVALITITRVVLFAALRYRIDNALFLHPIAMTFVLYLYLRSAWKTGVRREVLWRGRTYDAADTRFGA